MWTDAHMFPTSVLPTAGDALFAAGAVFMQRPHVISLPGFSSSLSLSPSFLHILSPLRFTGYWIITSHVRGETWSAALDLRPIIPYSWMITPWTATETLPVSSRVHHLEMERVDLSSLKNKMRRVKGFISPSLSLISGDWLWVGQDISRFVGVTLLSAFEGI